MGRLFDRVGIVILAWTVGIGSIFAPLVFLGGFYWALIGMILWDSAIPAGEFPRGENITPFAKK